MHFSDLFPGSNLTIPRNRRINDNYLSARSWLRRDPLTLDLDNDGIETVGASGSNVVLFDHDGDGIRTGTGWVKADDGLLVMDRNGNGTIDNGSELFGVDTVLQNGANAGQTASNGFTALADLDLNQDGVFDAADTAFADVRVWQDANQDGLSQNGELKTLTELGITSINLTATASTQNLNNGNTVALTGTYTKADGSTAGANALNLAENPFYREFSDGSTETVDNPFNQPTSGGIVLTEAALNLPDLHGSGAVRDLREAASLDSALAEQTQRLQDQGYVSRDELMAQVETFIQNWSDTSELEGSAGVHDYQMTIQNGDQVSTITSRYALIYQPAGVLPGDLIGVYGTQPAALFGTTSSGNGEFTVIGGDNSQIVTPGSYPAKWQRVVYLIEILERFNGLPFVSFNTSAVTTGNGSSQNIAAMAASYGTEAASNGVFTGGFTGALINSTLPIYVPISDNQLQLLEQSYAELVQSVYDGLVMQTRLKPYLDEVDLLIDETGIHADFTGLQTQLETRHGADETDAFIDILELHRYAGSGLNALGWEGASQLDEWIGEAEQAGTWTALRTELLEVFSYTGTQFADTLLGTSSVDVLYGYEGNDLLIGAAGDDPLYGQGGDDQLLGGTGNDYLMGGNGNDTVEGGIGNDYLYGGAGSYNDGLGNDTYVFGRGDGQDSITDQDITLGNLDTIRFKTGVLPSEVIVTRPQDNTEDLLLTIAGTTDSIRVKNWFYNTANRVERVEFADGTVWDLSVLIQAPITGDGNANILYGHDELAEVMEGLAGVDQLYGRGGDDTLRGGSETDHLYGGAGNDILEGGAGNDYLCGGTGSYNDGLGNDTYVFGRGDGQDSITDQDITVGNLDTIRFKAGISPSDVVISRPATNTYDLLLTIAGTTDSILIPSWFYDSSRRIERVEFADGTVWDEGVLVNAAIQGTSGNDTLSGMDGLGETIYGQAGNDLLYGLGGNDTLSGSSGDDYLGGGTGDDVLDGGSGNDVFRGESGDDTYLFGCGDGQDTIYEQDGQDTLRFKAGILPANVVLTRPLANTDDLLLAISGTSDSIRISGWFSAVGSRVESIEFSDGTVWNTSVLLSAPIVGDGATNNISGRDDLGETIDGRDGADLLYGRGGNDTLLGGSGGDMLSGGTGDDLLEGGTGNDNLYGGSGSHNDGLGNDTYLFGRGDGQDTIVDQDITVGNLDIIRFKAGIMPSDVLLSRPQDNTEDLLLTIDGTTDSIRINGWFYDTAKRIERVEFADGTVWDLSVLIQAPITGDGNANILYGHDELAEVMEGLAGVDQLYGRGGDDTLRGGSETDHLYGGAGNDILEGGAGNDYLCGGTGSYNDGLGNDTYLFGRGDGQDTIYDQDITVGNLDTIRLKAGISPSDVVISRPSTNTYDLLLSIAGTTDSILIPSWFYDSSRRIERVEFADGTVWDESVLINAAVQGSSGNDTVSGMDGLGEAMYGGAGNDVLYGLGGNDTLSGSSGDDCLEGGTGDDVLDGGSGNDALRGGSGNDTYLFGAGDGQDKITDNDSTAGNIDTLRFKAGLSPAQVVLTRPLDAPDDLLLSIAGTTDSVRIAGWFNSTAYRVERVEFADGTVWDSNVLLTASLIGDANANTLGGRNELNDIIYGMDGNDSLSGFAGDDSLMGGAGNDTLLGGIGNDVLDGGSGNDYLVGGGSGNVDGGAGNDIYLFGAGDGQDRITDNDSTAGNTDTLRFKAGVSPSQVLLTRPLDAPDDLLLSIAGTTDSVRITGWFNSTACRVERVEFADGTVWGSNVLLTASLIGDANANTLGGRNELNDIIYGMEGNDSLSGLAGDDSLMGGAGNDALMGGAGNDVLDGGSGSDYLYGGTNGYNDGLGNDTYLFGRGDGQDTIIDQDITVGNLDILRFKAGISPSDVVISRPASNTNDLLLSIAGTTDSILIPFWFYDPARRLERVEFADGTVWDSSVLLRAPLMGSTGNDDLTGGDMGETLLGLAGNDTLNGYAGNDLLEGGSGDDGLLGGAGNDTLDGGAGNDLLFGNRNPGGAGVQGDDTYLFGRGDGLDTIYDDNGGTGGNDTLKFKAGVLASDVTIYRSPTMNSGNDLVVSINGTTDSVRIYNWFGSVDNRVERFEFADGTVWDSSVLFQAPLLGDAGANTINGRDDMGDVIDAQDGNDYVYGFGGNDSLTGGNGDDILKGGTGNDVLEGGAGTDYLYGEAGNDTYIVDDSVDTVTENANEGTDLIQAGVTCTLTANVENLTLTGTAAISGTGNTLANILTGNGAANTLSGDAGADTLIGGAGNDTYVVDNAADVVTENASQGTDLVQSSVTYTLTTNVEKLTLTGTAAINGTGNTLANTLTGNAAANTLSGGDGNDTLNGGSGNDTLIGGLGDDTYVVNVSTDVVTEAASAGADTVQSSVTLTLGSNLEKLVLTGTGAINGTGNTLSNMLTGNSAANTLSGSSGNDTLDGGAGGDSMLGGTGNDTYVVDDATDAVTENLSEGTDLVQSSVTYILDDNVENLILTGTAAINGTGNTLDNVLTGNDGANTLNGSTGNDTMVGDDGSDTYYVDSTLDVVTETNAASAGGTDRVNSYLSSYTLGANIENGRILSTGSANLTGNTLNNVLYAGAGNNVLNGVSGTDTADYNYAASAVTVSLAVTTAQATGGSGSDTLANIDNLNGSSYDDQLTGNANANVFNGRTGDDTMIGGDGSDIYYVDSALDVVTETNVTASTGGTDKVYSYLSSYTLGANVEDGRILSATAANLTGNSLSNVLYAGDGDNVLNGVSGTDTADYLYADGALTISLAVTTAQATGSSGSDTLTNIDNLNGSNYNDKLTGNTAANVLNGGGGNDILEGGAGNDTLTDTSGKALFNGGSGNDSLTGGTSAEILLGGTGNDTLTTGAGNDIILFNKGDGQDTVTAGGTGSETLSLGGGIAYADLTFAKSTNDLVLKIGTTDQITFKDWYATMPSKPVVNLQVIAEAMAGFAAGGSDPLRDQKIESFDFGELVGAFDTARTANANLTSWALTNALTNCQLGGSDTAAIGGDLAYQYGKNGTLAGIGVTPALDTLASASLGNSAQTLSSLASLQVGTTRLS